MQNNLPQLNRPIECWQIPIQLIKITQSIVNGDKVENREVITFRGVVQPLRDEQLQFKPEGQRSWQWLWIHALTSVQNLQTQDKIEFNNKRYKVMSVKDYSLYGYIEYELVQDYEEQ